MLKVWAFLLKWQTLSHLSALEQRFKRRNSQANQQDRLQIRFNGKLKHNWYDLSLRLYATIEVAFCYAVFSVNPFSSRISKDLACAC